MEILDIVLGQGLSTLRMTYRYTLNCLIAFYFKSLNTKLKFKLCFRYEYICMDVKYLFLFCFQHIDIYIYIYGRLNKFTC